MTTLLINEIVTKIVEIEPTTDVSIDGNLLASPEWDSLYLWVEELGESGYVVVKVYDSKDEELKYSLCSQGVTPTVVAATILKFIDVVLNSKEIIFGACCVIRVRYPEQRQIQADEFRELVHEFVYRICDKEDPFGFIQQQVAEELGVELV